MTLLHLQHASMQHTDTDRQLRADLDTILGRNADAVGFTEVNHDHRTLAQACAEHGYILVQPDRTETALAVHGDHELVTAGAQLVLPRNPAPARKGGHAARHICWGTANMYGELVSVHVGHWNTGMNRRKLRHTQHDKLTRAMAKAVAEQAKGHRLGFWTGDTNVPDRHKARTSWDRITRRRDLTTCWDELGKYPRTHGRRTIDVIGSYDPDTRVAARSARAWPRGHSDHRAISAWYDVAPRQEPAPAPECTP